MQEKAYEETFCTNPECKNKECLCDPCRCTSSDPCKCCEVKN